MTSLSEEIHYVPKSISFSVFAVDEIRKLSKVEITTAIGINDLGQPLPNGLYDLRMGPYMRDFGACTTCFQNYLHCPGHLGHIELVLPVINPLFRSVVINLLSRTCLECSSLLYSGPFLTLTRVQLELLELGLSTEALAAVDLAPASALGSARKQTKRDKEQELELDMEDAPTSAGHHQVTQKLLDYLYRIKALHASGKVLREVRNVVLERRAIVQRFLAQKPLKECPQCSSKQPSLNDYLGHVVKIDRGSRRKKDAAEGSANDLRSYLTTTQARDVLRNLWKKEHLLLCDVFGLLKTVKEKENPTDCFFMEVLPVTAPRLRPMSLVREKHTEHTQSHVYATIVECNRLLQLLVSVRQSGADVATLPPEQARPIDKVRGETLDDKVMRTWGTLQGLVDCVVDSDMNKLAAKRLDVKDLKGIRQMLEKKDGIIRMNMMGKRVDYAGRTVITPDPYLSVEELGVPVLMAKKLTYPEPVTPQNVNLLRQAILNGPNNYPGANAIEYGNGKKIALRDDWDQLASRAKALLAPICGGLRKDLVGPKVIHRHLLSGDVVLLNRQPTLHRPSILAHRVRVLPGEKTFRLHYSNCKSYNADFDGDEMNLHLPQGQEARSEAYNLAYSSFHFLVPKDGTPLGGLIQDHVVAGVKMTMRGTFFTRAEYQQLVASGLGDLRDQIVILPPAILKPRQLWTGKQVVSTILINLTPAGRPPINLRSKAKLNPKIWQRERSRPCRAGGAIVEPDLSESEVIIRSGHLLCGVLDKQQYGAVPYSLVHGFHELYGGGASSRLLSAFSRLFTFCLQLYGFTLGVQDILVKPAADRRRQQAAAKSTQIGVEATAEALGMKSAGADEDVLAVQRRLEEVHLARDPRAQRDLDRAYKKQLDQYNNDINRVCLPLGLIQKFPDNNLQLMVESGAKGSKVNTMQISCLLGQIELEGKRPPRMISGKTLPSFVPYDLTPRAGGFITGRFMTGIRPQEYFFHCMAGREGLIDTAVKTSRSGYLQRCLIKHLEGLLVNYDLTVRDSDGSVIQFRYGEDGFETEKVQYLTPQQLPFFGDNFRGLVEPGLIDDFKRRSKIEAIRKLRKKIRKWRREFGDPTHHRRSSPFLEFSRRVPPSADGDPVTLHPVTNRSTSYHRQLELWQQQEDTAQFVTASRRCPDPVYTCHRPDSHFWSVCERMDQLVSDYLTSRPGPASPELEDLLYYKCARACVQPGEAVGLVAAQSVGEPSTQMTLNTFHFAGRGDMNVTLGIPRLREILSASKSMKTPSMEIPFRNDVPDLPRRAQQLKLQLTRVTLAQVLRQVKVTEKLKQGRCRMYRLRLEFLPRSAYKHEFAVTPSSILRYVETVWVPRFLKRLSKAMQFRDTGTVLDNDVGATDEVPEDLDDPGEEGGGSPDDPAPEAQRDQRPTQTEDEPDQHSEGEEDPDDDATAARSRARLNDEGDYESAEEEDADVLAEANQPDAENDVVPGEDEVDASRDVQQDIEEFDSDWDEKEDPPSNVAVSARKVAVLTQKMDSCAVERYKYDEKHERWCEITLSVSTSRQCDIQTLVREAASAGVIREVPKISRVFVVDDEQKGLRLCTEGINMLYMVRFSDLLNLDQMYCNDVHSMASTYGVEAANRAIVKEISSVFEVYGIRVSPRHLSLIADYMTFGGRVCGFNRSAMEWVVSPLQQMSFETTMRFLRSAVLTGQVDELKSPSARLVLGRPFNGGTGMFSLLNKMQV